MNNDNRDLEDFLYKIIEEVSKENAPIVFKGGLALKDILSHSNPNNVIDRKTIDIDANWTGKVNYDEITKVFQKAVQKVDKNCRIELNRLPSTNKSMGYKILDNENRIVSKIDIDIKDNPFYVIFTVEDINIKYSSLEKIMADKLNALSGEHVFRRSKDLLDIYLILKNNEVKFEKIKEILNYDNRELKDFSYMIKNAELMRDSYEKLNGIVNKPSFEEVWKTVIDYLKQNELIKNNINEDAIEK